MNRKVLAFAALVSATGAQYANAIDGTINFNGQLTATTCDIAVNGSGASTAAVVTLPTVSTGSLASNGQTAGQTAFNITLANCSGTNQTAAAFFEAGPSVDQASGQLRNTTGTAGNVRLQLVDLGNNAVIRAGNAEQRTTAFRNAVTSTGTPSQGSANLPYAVRYIASGQTTPGTVLSTVTYSIDYQ